VFKKIYLKSDVLEDFMQRTWNQSDNYRWRYRLARKRKTRFFTSFKNF